MFRPLPFWVLAPQPRPLKKCGRDLVAGTGLTLCSHPVSVPSRIMT